MGVDVVPYTLGSCLSCCETADGGSSGSGMRSTFFNEVVISSRAFLTGYPVCKEGTIEYGGCASSVIISVAACFK